MNLKTPLKPQDSWISQNWLSRAVALCFATTLCWGQGTMQFIFSGPAYPGAPAPTPIGTSLNTSTYSEAGMLFSNLNAPRGLPLAGGGISSMPENGTPYLALGPGDALGFRFSDTRIFDLISFDVAEGPTNFPGPATLHVVGYAYEGRAITTDITTDGINDGTGPLADFETFTLPDVFRNLFKVEITGGGNFSLDNVRILVPEPSAGALALLGAACLLERRRHSKGK